MQSALKLAAALPDDDFPAFVLATVIALADVLQRDSVDDDLFWNWDAFHAHYGLVDADARAVLMNGFRVIDRTGLTRLDPPPDAGMCYTHSFADVTRALEGSSSNRLVQAIHEDISPEDAGDLWENADKVLLSTGETMAFRYLAERPKGMAPPNAETVALLPPQM